MSAPGAGWWASTAAGDHRRAEGGIGGMASACHSLRPAAALAPRHATWLVSGPSGLLPLRIIQAGARAGHRAVRWPGRQRKLFFRCRLSSGASRPIRSRSTRGRDVTRGYRVCSKHYGGIWLCDARVGAALTLSYHWSYRQQREPASKQKLILLSLESQRRQTFRWYTQPHDDV